MSDLLDRAGKLALIIASKQRPELGGKISFAVEPSGSKHPQLFVAKRNGQGIKVTLGVGPDDKRFGTAITFSVEAAKRLLDTPPPPEPATAMTGKERLAWTRLVDYGAQELTMDGRRCLDLLSLAAALRPGNARQIIKACTEVVEHNGANKFVYDSTGNPIRVLSSERAG